MQNDCVFCKIANKEIPVDVAYEDNDFVAFNDVKTEVGCACNSDPKNALWVSFIIV